MCMHSGAHGKTKKISSCTLLTSTAVKIYKTEITKHFITLNFYFIFYFLRLHLIPLRTRLIFPVMSTHLALDRAKQQSRANMGTMPLTVKGL